MSDTITPEKIAESVDFLGWLADCVAPEDKQRDALGKMSAPAKAALLESLKQRKDAGTLKPVASPPTVDE